MKKLTEDSFLRLPQVLELIPISRSAWWQGCKDGRFPKPIKLGPRTSVWRSSDIAALIKQLSLQSIQEEKTRRGNTMNSSSAPFPKGGATRA